MPDGGPFWMLIDCGIHTSIARGSETIEHIVDDILRVTRRLDVIVMTHEHWDHISGFSTAREKFRQFDVGEIWLGWTEDPADPQARALDKFKGDAFKAIQGASQRLERLQGLSPHLAAVQKGLRQVLAFNFGAKGEKVRAARDALVGLRKDNRRYLEPQTAPFALSIGPGKNVPNVRVYVLGPPREAAMLKLTERASEMYGMGAAIGGPEAGGLNHAFNVSDGGCEPWDDATAPFDPYQGLDLSDCIAALAAEPAPADAKAAPNPDPKLKPKDTPEGLSRARAAKLMRDSYLGKASDWRRIDHDWLGVSADLAIQLDQRTNNSSLVLAFEFVDTQRVMLFVGDAQAGNWLSWKEVNWTVDGVNVSAHDLLARTVFYKVGHHGSHNATLKQNGLQLMTSPDLSAFIPTNKEDATNVGWGEMPFAPLLDDLEKRARNRVIRADDTWLRQPGGQPPAEIISGAIKALRRHPEGLWVELDVG
jgi:hypothetical protein